MHFLNIFVFNDNGKFLVIVLRSFLSDIRFPLRYISIRLASISIVSFCTLNWLLPQHYHHLWRASRRTTNISQPALRWK